MQLVKQPKGSSLCGQACVATICGTTLEEAISLVGKKGQTKTIHLKRALHATGIDHDACRTRGAPLYNETAFLYFQSKDRKAAHWVVWHKKKYYDPIAGVHRKLPNHLKESDLTSHLKVYLERH